MIEESGKVLLVRRKDPPYAERWSLPIGLVQFGETAEECARRVTAQATGLQVAPVALISSYSDQSNPEYSLLVLVFRARAVAGEWRTSAERGEVRWFPLETLPELGFPQSRHALAQWVQIRNGPVNAVHFCPRCRGRLERRRIGDQEHPACPTCHYVHFNNPIPIVEVIVADQSRRVLLVKRKLPPRIGDWALPGGFVDFGESAEQAAVREVGEETGLHVQVVRLQKTLGLPSQINPEQCILKSIFVAEITGGELRAGDDAAEARFFARDELPENLASIAERRVIEEWWEG